MLHDRFIFNRSMERGGGEGWTVNTYLDDLDERYGGVDSVLLWHSYPNIGIDDRNQFDMLASLPGGLAGVRRLVADFHARGVRVLLPYNPWDQGTRPTGAADHESMVRAVIEVGADGFVSQPRPHNGAAPGTPPSPPPPPPPPPPPQRCVLSLAVR